MTIPKELDYGRVAETIKGIPGVLRPATLTAHAAVLLSVPARTEERVNPARKGSLLRIGGIINEE